MPPGRNVNVRGKPLHAPRRYQLGKTAVRVVQSGHPWIFRKHLSSAAAVFADGQWLRLVGGDNQVVGWGFYQEVGAIGIRVLRPGPEPPRAGHFESMLRAALARRVSLRATTNGFRALHGENDGIPAVTADVYDDVAVVSSYARGADSLARFVARKLRGELGLSGVLWKPGSRRQGPGGAGLTERVVSGRVPELVRFHEDAREIVVAPFRAQKSGAFLDLRGLRRFLNAQSLSGLRVLDLFSFTGTLGAAAEAAGAREIWHVDSSGTALALGAAHHQLDPDHHRWIEADVFEWEPPAGERFDLVVVDPPQMTSRAAQVQKVLRAYDRLYRRLEAHVLPGGLLVACCCTSRVEAELFRQTVRQALPRDFRFVERLPPEADHPVGFAEADYLKILVFRRKPEKTAAPDS